MEYKEDNRTVEQLIQAVDAAQMRVDMEQKMLLSAQEALDARLAKLGLSRKRSNEHPLDDRLDNLYRNAGRSHFEN